MVETVMDGVLVRTCNNMPQSQAVAIVVYGENDSETHRGGRRSNVAISCRSFEEEDECPQHDGREATFDDSNVGSVSGSGASDRNKELSHDVEEASKVVIVTADREMGGKKIVSFAAATDGVTSESARLKDTTEHRKLEPRLPLHIIDVQNHSGRDETTISTLSFGQKLPVQVETPREKPCFYVGIVLALIASASSAFVIAFRLASR